MSPDRLNQALTKAAYVELYMDEKTGKHVVALSFEDKAEAAEAFMGVSDLQDAKADDADEDACV